MTGADAEWFAGARSPFIDAMKGLAVARLADLVSRDATFSYLFPFREAVDPVSRGSLAVVELHDAPALGPGRVLCLQVLWYQDVLSGYWGDNYLWDDFDEEDFDALLVKGRMSGDLEAADTAIDWLARQLTRPVELQEWQRAGATVTRAWVLADTGAELGSEGSARKRRGVPTRTSVVRP